MRKRDERGAVALIVGLLSVLLLGISAFTVDLGMAYVTKRQLSSAADAASLAADAIYKKEYSGTCAVPGNDPKNPTAANAKVLGDAEVAADSLFIANYPKGSKTDGNITDVKCNGSGVQVTYSASGTSGSPFGVLLGGSGTITTDGDAAASYTAGADASGGIRPWGVCSNALNQTGNVTQVSMSNTQNTGCPGIGESGTWNRYACPGHAKGSTPDTVSWITDGCPVPPAASPIPNTTGLSPSDLWSYLSTYCTQGKNGTSTSTCLTRDTGNVNKNKMSDAWQGLIDDKTVFQTPVFCAKPICSADAMGSGGEFPIYALATVRICGFQLHGVVSGKWPAAPDECSTMNPSHYSPTSTVPGGGNVMYLIFEGYTTVDGDSFGQSSPLHLSK
jgi:Flp pilus assembly protein TadG